MDGTYTSKGDVWMFGVLMWGLSFALCASVAVTSTQRSSPTARFRTTHSRIFK